MAATPRGARSSGRRSLSKKSLNNNGAPQQLKAQMQFEAEDEEDMASIEDEYQNHRANGPASQ